VTVQLDMKPLTYLCPVALADTEFIGAENCLRKWRVFHDRYVVCVYTQASASWRYRGRTHQAVDAGYALMEPGETHVNLLVPQPQSYTVLRISPAVIEQAAGELGAQRNPHFALPDGRNPRVIRAFERLQATVSSGESVLEQQTRFAVFLRAVLENCVERPRVSAVRDSRALHASVERAKMYLRERFNDSVSLDELASAADLSRFHLVRTFTRQVGMPPHAYRIRVQVERACRLMQTGVPPSDAAMAVGFADQSHFTRHFRKVLDITPGGYFNSRNRLF
jgi:AraC-like DNA-binding protein